jgi:hypothetical protein
LSFRDTVLALGGGKFQCVSFRFWVSNMQW